MLSKALGVGCVVLALAAAHFRTEMYAERARHVATAAERDSLKEVVVPALKDANQRVSDTLDFTLDLHSNQLGKTDGYLERLQQADRRTAEAVLELDRLRATEHRRAIETPFERGNAARSRITLSLCRAWNLGPDDDPRCRDAGGDGDAGSDAGSGSGTGTDADGSAGGSNND